ncbi:ABC transporter ATP-binding protein [bacterium]|nr:ABC transporter ATP-binding protein [bacterium]
MPPLLQIDRVSKTYDAPDDAAPPVVLREVSLEVQAGESLAIVGPSGCGKSTLLNIIGGLDRPSEGTVLLDGRDMASLDDRQLAAVRNQDIGFVFQLHHLLPQCTALENVLVPTLVDGSAGAKKARATALLERVGLEHRLNYRPGRLSGGERQRAAVVRALINSPKLLLADEPTGALDEQSAASLMDLLIELNREEGVALIVVTHARELAGRMSRVLTLSDGGLA